MKRTFRKSFGPGLNDKLKKSLASRGVEVRYEDETFEYEVPAKKRKYTPDFAIYRKDGSKFFVEGKGWFQAQDRVKHLLVKASCPDLEVRFVFSGANKPINKGSKTTYGAWATKHGFLWAEKDIPQSWLEE